ncbi:MAG: PqqD family protein [Clostridia bacterium]|nr:PqqD family protein [Clostridia bacterium]
MKINENFVLKSIAGEAVVMPVGDAVNKVNGMIKLNPTAEVIWKALEQETTLEDVISAVRANCQNVNEATIIEDVVDFTEKLRKLGILEE